MTESYEQAYKDVREFMDHPSIFKAIEFAIKNPEVVYGKDTDECNAVQGGLLDLYFSTSISRAKSLGTQTV